jgi:Plasmid pRiA4b ORF-3-like protein
VALPRPNLIYQFKITLEDISPAIWRRILVPARYTFWDFHVAIQDSMGWLDYHLHAFELKAPGSGKRVEVGIPDEEFDRPVIPG